MPFDWEGPRVRRIVLEAGVKAANETMGRAVVQAKKRPRMPVVTGKAQGSVRIVEVARIVGNFIKGRWGSAGDVSYFPKIEKRKRPLRGGASEAYPEFLPRWKKHVKAALR